MCLRPKARNLIRRRADEGDAERLAAAGELGIFGQEAIARMDAVRAGAVNGLQNAIGVEVALRRGGAADGDGLVGGAHEAGAGVRLGVDRHRRDPHLSQGAEDAEGDRPPVGDQDFAEHADYSRLQTRSRTGVGL